MIRHSEILLLFLLTVCVSAFASASDFKIEGKDVVVLDARGAEVDTLKLEGIPAALQHSPDGRLLYVRLANENSIAVYDTKTLELVDWYSLDRVVNGRMLDPDFWSVDPVGGRLGFRDMKGESVFADEYRDAARLAEAPAPAPLLVAAGGEFDLSTLSGPKSNPSGDFDDNGNFTASWTDLDGHDGSGEGVYVREFNANGDPQSTEFHATVGRSGDQGNSNLSLASNGDIVVVWRDGSGQDGDDLGVFGRRFSKGGNPKDNNDIKIPNTTQGRQKEPAVDSEPNGDFVAVWDGPIGGNKAILARRYNANGTPKESEIIVATSSNEYAPDVATNSSGRFVVVWRDGADDLIHARMYNSSGNPVGAAFKVDSDPHNQFVANVGMDDSGNFTISWQSVGAGGVLYRQFDANGSPKGASRVAGHNGAQEYAPSLSMNSNGKFCIAWRDDLLNAWARAFDANGNPLQSPFRTSAASGDQLESNCAIDQDGNFFVSWKYRPGGGGAIRGRKFNAGGSPSLDVSCTATPDHGDAPLSVDFTATASGGAGSFTYAWDFGDGGAGTRQNPSHTYDTSGTFNAVVTVTSGGDTATCNRAITVGGTPPGNVKVNSLTKTKADRNTPDTVLSVKGKGFQNGATVSFNDPAIEVSTTKWIDNTRIKIHINVKSAAFLGLHDVTVANPDNSKGTGVFLFKVEQGGAYPAPTVLTVDPPTVNGGTSPTLKVTGLDFARDPAGLKVNAGEGITIASVNWISPTEIHVSTNVSGQASCGSRNVIVSNLSADSVPCAGCLQVSSNKLSLGAVTPGSLHVGQGPANITIQGCGFNQNSSAKIKGVDRISQTVVDSSTIIITVKVKDGTDPGFKKVTVQNSNDRVRRKDLFQVKP